MTTTALCPQPNYRSFTLAGAPNAGGTLNTYISGTTTPQVTYTSSTAAVQNANPVVFDANGFANVWLDASLTYTLLEKAADGSTIRTQDVISNAAGATGAAGTFACSAATGTADAITATYSPVLTLADKTMCAIVSSGANTVTNPTFAPDGLTAHTVTKRGGQALIAGDIGAALSVHILEYNLANTRWELLNPSNPSLLTNTFTGAQIGTVTALTSTSNSIAINLATNNNFSHTFTENTTLANPSNVVAGQSGSIALTQHASSPKTLAYGSYYKFPGGSVPTVTATNSAIDTLYYSVRSATVIECNLVKGFA